MSRALERAARRPHPRWAVPMLALLAAERFSSEEWIFERKLDGERCLAFRRGRELRLLSRTRKLRYAGKVGTGYSDAILRDLGARLARLEQKEPPFAPDQLPRAAVHWVRPELVAQVGFTEVTGDGKLRHPRFLGLRRDKPPREVVLEQSAR